MSPHHKAAKRTRSAARRRRRNITGRKQHSGRLSTPAVACRRQEPDSPLPDVISARHAAPCGSQAAAALSSIALWHCPCRRSLRPPLRRSQTASLSAALSALLSACVGRSVALCVALCLGRSQCRPGTGTGIVTGSAARSAALSSVSLASPLSVLWHSQRRLQRCRSRLVVTRCHPSPASSTHPMAAGDGCRCSSRRQQGRRGSRRRARQ